jgi:hypothetical protein
VNFKKIAKWFGIIFIAVGILGFIPGFTHDSMLLGILDVNGPHNFIEELPCQTGELLDDLRRRVL